MSLYRTILKASSGLTPRLKLHLMDPNCASWSSDHHVEDSPFENDPFWAIYWPGGQALTRYILDYPEVVAGKRVLELGCGCGASSIASALSGANHVLANDIDPEALRMTLLNAKVNGVNGRIETSSINYLAGKDLLKDEFDTVLIGDMFYDHEIVDSVMGILNGFEGEVLIGDPGRWALKEYRPPLECLAKFDLPSSAKMENNGFLHGYVYRLLKNTVGTT